MLLDKGKQRFGVIAYYPPQPTQIVYDYGYNTVTHCLLIYSSQALLIYSIENSKVIKTKQLSTKYMPQQILKSIIALPLTYHWAMIKSHSIISIIDSSLEAVAECQVPTTLSSISLYQREQQIVALSNDRLHVLILNMENAVSKENKQVKLLISLKEVIVLNNQLHQTVVNPELGYLYMLSSPLNEILVWNIANSETLFSIDLSEKRKGDKSKIIPTLTDEPIFSESMQSEDVKCSVIMTSLEEILLVYYSDDGTLQLWNVIQETPLKQIKVDIADPINITVTSLQSELTAFIIDANHQIYEVDLTRPAIIGSKKLEWPQSQSHILFDQSKETKVIPVHVNMESAILATGETDLILFHNGAIQFVESYSKSESLITANEEIDTVEIENTIDSENRGRMLYTLYGNQHSITTYKSKERNHISKIEMRQVLSAKWFSKISFLHYEPTLCLIVCSTETGDLLFINITESRTYQASIGHQKVLKAKVITDSRIGNSEYTIANLFLLMQSGSITNMQYNKVKNTFTLKERYSASYPVTSYQLDVIQNSLRILYSVKEGFVEMFSCDALQITPETKIATMRNGITAFSLTSNDIIIVGYDNGVMHSHPFKGYSTQSHYKVHEYHTAPIQAIRSEGYEFYSFCGNNKIAKWKLDSWAPLKICSIGEPVKDIFTSDGLLFAVLNSRIELIAMANLCSPISYGTSSWQSLNTEREKILGNYSLPKDILNQLISNAKTQLQYTNYTTPSPLLNKTLLETDLFGRDILESELIIYPCEATSKLFYLTGFRKKEGSESKEKKVANKVTFDFLQNINETERHKGSCTSRKGKSYCIKSQNKPKEAVKNQQNKETKKPYDEITKKKFQDFINSLQTTSHSKKDEHTSTQLKSKYCLSQPQFTIANKYGMEQSTTEYKRFNEIEPTRMQLYASISNPNTYRMGNESDIGIGINTSNDTVKKITEPTYNADKFLYGINKEFKITKRSKNKSTVDPPLLFPIRRSINYVEYNKTQDPSNVRTSFRGDQNDATKPNYDDEFQKQKQKVSAMKNEENEKLTLRELEKAERIMMRSQMKMDDKVPTYTYSEVSIAPQGKTIKVILPINTVYIDANFKNNVVQKDLYVDVDQQILKLHNNKIPVVHYDELINQVHDILFFNPSIRPISKEDGEVEVKNKQLSIKGHLETIVLIPKVFSYFDGSPKMQPQDLSAYKIDMNELILYFQRHAQESIKIDKLNSILSNIGHRYEESDMSNIQASLKGNVKKNIGHPEYDEIKAKHQQERAEAKLNNVMRLLITRLTLHTKESPQKPTLSKECSKDSRRVNANQKYDIKSKLSGDEVEAFIRTSIIPNIIEKAITNKPESPSNNAATLIDMSCQNTHSLQSLKTSRTNLNDIVPSHFSPDKIINASPPQNAIQEKAKKDIPSNIKSNDSSPKKSENTNSASSLSPSNEKLLKKQESKKTILDENDLKKQLENEAAKLKINQLLQSPHIVNSIEQDNNFTKEIQNIEIMTENKAKTDEPVVISPEATSLTNDIIPTNDKPAIKIESKNDSKEVQYPPSQIQYDLSKKLIVNYKEKDDTTAKPAISTEAEHLPAVETNSESSPKKNSYFLYRSSTLRSPKKAVPKIIRKSPADEENGLNKIIEEENNGDKNVPLEIKIPINEQKHITASLKIPSNSENRSFLKSPTNNNTSTKNNEKTKKAQKSRANEEFPVREDSLEKRIEDQLENAKITKEIEEREKKRMSRRSTKELIQLKSPSRVQRVSELLKIFDNGNISSGLKQLTDLQNLMPSDSTIGEDCEKILSTFFNTSAFPKFHNAPTSISDKMYFSKQITPFFDNVETDPLEYLELQNTVNRIKLFLRQNPTIYRTNDMRMSTTMQQFNPNIDPPADYSVKMYDRLEVTFLTQALDQLELRIQKRLKDLKKIEKDQLSSQNPLPKIKRQSLSPERRLVLHGNLDYKLPTLPKSTPKMSKNSKIVINEDLFKKRKEMTQIELLERRCQILTQTHFNKYKCIRNMSVPKYKL